MLDVSALAATLDLLAAPGAAPAAASASGGISGAATPRASLVGQPTPRASLGGSPRLATPLAGGPGTSRRASVAGLDMSGLATPLATPARGAVPASPLPSGAFSEDASCIASAASAIVFFMTADGSLDAPLYLLYR